MNLILKENLTVYVLILLVEFFGATQQVLVLLVQFVENILISTTLLLGIIASWGKYFWHQFLVDSDCCGKILDLLLEFLFLILEEDFPTLSNSLNSGFVDFLAE